MGILRPSREAGVVSEVRSPVSTDIGPLAQLVEQLTLNQLVVGSIPTRPTNTPLPRTSSDVQSLLKILIIPLEYRHFSVQKRPEAALDSQFPVGAYLGAS